MERRTVLITANNDQMLVGSQMMEHVHICYQLYYIADGNPVFIVDDVEICAHPGSFFYIPPQTPHRMLPLHDGAMTYFEFKVHINDTFIASHLKKACTPEQDTGYILHMLRYVYNNWRSSDPQNLQNIDNILSSLLMGFFLQNLHYSQTDSCRINTQHYDQITRAAMAYIEKNYQQRFTLQNLSNTLNYNKYYTSSLFIKNTGISIGDYLNLIRIRQAVIMFAFYSQDVFTTCESVGYLNLSHFSRTFKALTGASPRSFKYVFSKVDRKLLRSFFTDEPILSLQVCTLEEAFASLRSIGNTVNRILTEHNAEQ